MNKSDQNEEKYVDLEKAQNDLLTPDALMASVNEKNIAAFKEKGTVIANIRSPENHELEQVKKIKDNINIKDSLNIIQYGTEAQTELTNFADKLLSEVKLKDFGETGDAIKSISQEIMSVDKASSRTFLSSLPIVGKYLQAGKEKIQSRMDTAKDTIDRLVENLEIQKHYLGKDVNNLSHLYDENKKLVRSLELFIYAAEEKLPEIREDLKLLLDKAQETNDAVDAQNYTDGYKALDRFEKRLDNLKRARLAAIQGATQIRLTQESNHMLIDDINEVINNVIPEWKKQFIQALSIERQQIANEIVKVSKDSSNFLYKKNADNMDSLITAVGQGYARGIYDIEAMEQVNASTINTLKKTLTIHQDAKIAREASQKKLAKMEEDLKQTLLDASQSYKKMHQ